jgi:osmoprotectant transport system permease protein
MSKFFEYGVKHYDKLFGYLLEHLQMCAIAMIISLIIAIPLSILLLKRKNLSKLIISLLGACYAIPSMAFFAILMPIFGLGKTGAIVVLTVYSQFILTRNILAGFEGIDTRLLESANGMGMSTLQSFFKIQLPLALPVIIGGIRIATVATIGSAVIAQTINAGGIGVLLFEGLRTLNTVKMLWGTILAAALALICNYLLENLERYTLKISRGEIE